MITDAMAEKLGLTKKSADAFSKAFWNVIIEGLNADGIVRIKGFGTFKLVDISSRESVNVATGERFVIQGHKRVSFVPDDTANAFFATSVSEGVVDDGKDAEADDGNASESEAEPVADVAALSEVEETEATAAEAGRVEEQYDEDTTVSEAVPVEYVEAETETDGPADVSADDGVAEVQPDMSENAENDVADSEEDKTQSDDVEPEYEEKAADEFSGIDLIISTPESIEDAKRRLDQARANAERTAREAEEAKEELTRQEQLVERLMKNLAPVEAHEKEEAENVETSSEDVRRKEEIDSNGSHRHSGEHVIEGNVAHGFEKSRRGRRKNSLKMLIVAVLAVIVVAGAVAIYMLSNDKSGKPDVKDLQKQLVEERKNEAAKAELEAKRRKEAYADSVRAKQVADSIRAVKAKVAADSLKRAEAVRKPVRPATYVLRKGESLTKVSQKFYGTKDSVYAIIKANKFKNPDNVPVGTTVKLP